MLSFGFGVTSLLVLSSSISFFKSAASRTCFVNNVLNFFSGFIL